MSEGQQFYNSITWVYECMWCPTSSSISCQYLHETGANQAMWLKLLTCPFTLRLMWLRLASGFLSCVVAFSSMAWDWKVSNTRYRTLGPSASEIAWRGRKGRQFILIGRGGLLKPPTFCESQELPLSDGEGGSKMQSKMWSKMKSKMESKTQS